MLYIVSFCYTKLVAMAKRSTLLASVIPGWLLWLNALLCWLQLYQVGWLVGWLVGKTGQNIFEYGCKYVKW